MKTYAKTLLLQDDPAKIEEYKKQHAAVWPETLAALRRCGITGMQIYLIGRRNLTETGNYDLMQRDLSHVAQTTAYLGAYSQQRKRCSLWSVDPRELGVTLIEDLPSRGDTCFRCTLKHVARWTEPRRLPGRGRSTPRAQRRRASARTAPRRLTRVLQQARSIR